MKKHAGLILTGLFFVAACSTPVAGQAPRATGVTVFEGARLIVGDGGAPIENSAFVVETARFTQVGTARAGEGAGGRGSRGSDRQDRDAGDHRHAHAPRAQRARRSSISCSATRTTASPPTLSLGQDAGDVPFQVRGETIPNAARYRTAGRGHHDAGAGPNRQSRTGSRPKPKPGRRCRSWPPGRSTSSRSGSTTATASTRS